MKRRENKIERIGEIESEKEREQMEKKRKAELWTYFIKDLFCF